MIVLALKRYEKSYLGQYFNIEMDFLTDCKKGMGQAIFMYFWII